MGNYMYYLWHLFLKKINTDLIYFFSLIIFSTLNLLPISDNNLYASTKSSNIKNMFSFINQSYWEVNIMPIMDGMPSIDNGNDIYGGRAAISNFFYNYNKTLEFGIDLSVAHLKTNRSKDEPNFSKSITILSPALVGRWYFTKWGPVDLFVTAGIGPSYMSNNDFEGRDLGINFAFQDIGGIGFKSIKKNNKDTGELVAGLYIIHYSNASINPYNRGITIPFSFNLAYRF